MSSSNKTLPPGDGLSIFSWLTSISGSSTGTTQAHLVIGCITDVFLKGVRYVAMGFILIVGGPYFFLVAPFRGTFSNDIGAVWSFLCKKKGNVSAKEEILSFQEFLEGHPAVKEQWENMKERSDANEKKYENDRLHCDTNKDAWKQLLMSSSCVVPCNLDNTAMSLDDVDHVCWWLQSFDPSGFATIIETSTNENLITFFSSVSFNGTWNNSLVTLIGGICEFIVESHNNEEEQTKNCVSILTKLLDLALGERILGAPELVTICKYLNNDAMLYILKQPSSEQLHSNLVLIFEVIVKDDIGGCIYGDSWLAIVLLLLKITPKGEIPTDCLFSYIANRIATMNRCHASVADMQFLYETLKSLYDTLGKSLKETEEEKKLGLQRGELLIKNALIGVTKMLIQRWNPPPGDLPQALILTRAIEEDETLNAESGEDQSQREPSLCIQIANARSERLDAAQKMVATSSPTTSTSQCISPTIHCEPTPLPNGCLNQGFTLQAPTLNENVADSSQNKNSRDFIKDIFKKFCDTIGQADPLRPYIDDLTDASIGLEDSGYVACLHLIEVLVPFFCERATSKNQNAPSNDQNNVICNTTDLVLNTFENVFTFNSGVGHFSYRLALMGVLLKIRQQQYSINGDYLQAAYIAVMNSIYQALVDQTDADDTDLLLLCKRSICLLQSFPRISDSQKCQILKQIAAVAASITAADTKSLMEALQIVLWTDEQLVQIANSGAARNQVREAGRSILAKSYYLIGFDSISHLSATQVDYLVSAVSKGYAQGLKSDVVLRLKQVFANANAGLKIEPDELDFSHREDTSTHLSNAHDLDPFKDISINYPSDDGSNKALKKNETNDDDYFDY
ncbi:MAG: hypothetical protein LBP65_00870 [Puniceicoccales bacterium]|jgi:hypothetical protein|nr:hypothetical protein [Puniceicoccales bacterium]